tara:strand:+ start:906 stop:1262 length:357 start_codon:yes stop_codon:yes gene_type:complete
MCLIPDHTLPNNDSLVAIDIINNETIIGFFHGVQKGYCYISCNPKRLIKIRLNTIMRVLDLTPVMKDDMYLQITLRSGKPIFSQIHATRYNRTQWLLDIHGEMVGIPLTSILDVSVLE